MCDVMMEALLRDSYHLGCTIFGKCDDTGDFGLVLVKSGPASRDLMGGGDRDVIRFYSKRSKYQLYMLEYAATATKSQPKIGKCHHCSEEKERSSLRICG